MGVYINMEMPTVGRILITFPSGRTLEVSADNTQNILGEAKAVPVPPHGDLIERDQFIEFIKTHWDSYDQWFVEQLEARPTIIPAEEK